MNKIKAFFTGAFSKFMKMENKGVAVLLGLQMALCLTAVIVAIVVATKVPTGTPPKDAEISGDADGDNDITLPESLAFCYVSFDCDGGGRIAKQRVWRGDIPIEPKEPKKDGYYFTGWTLDGAPYDFTETVSENVTLKAGWLPYLNCVFEYDDGTDSITVTCKAGETISAPNRAPKRDDAYFVGWCVDNEPWSFDTAVTESMTLTPTYSTTAEITLSLGYSPFLENDVTLDAEYTAASMKPVFGSLAERFDVVFKNHASVGDSRLDDAIEAGAELILSDVSSLCDKGASVKNLLLDFRDYLDRMPNFARYLEENPTVLLSLFASSSDKSIYALPIPELYRRPTALPLMNGEIIRTLLDGDEPFVSSDTATMSSPKYFESIPLSEEIRVPVVSDGEVTYFTKPSQTYGNVINAMNDAMNLHDGSLTGALAVELLRAHIDATYGDRLTKRSDLFLGSGAMYDTDELVALLRCVMLNRETLGLSEGGAPIVVSSYDELLTLTEMLFGQRGLAADSEHLYFDGDGTLYDVRANENSYAAVRKMRELIAEGLVVILDGGEAYRDSVLTLYRMGDESERCSDAAFSVCLPPLAYFADFSEVMRFLPEIEMYSERAFSVLGSVKGDPVKLNATLSILDYIYSDEGCALINLGTAAFRSESLASELASGLAGTLSAGDYNAFLRDYLGAVAGNSAYVCYGDAHAEMLATIDSYLKLGAIGSNNTLWEDDYLYSYVPNRLPATDYNEEKLLEFTEITSADGEYSFANPNNIYVRILKGEIDREVNLSEHFRLEIDGNDYQTLLRRIVAKLKTYYIYL